MKFLLGIMLLFTVGCVPIMDPLASQPVDTTSVDTTPVNLLPFDGTWFVQANLESRQGVVGPVGLTFEVQRGRVVCVTEKRTETCSAMYDNPKRDRPITIDNGFILINFSMDFNACQLSCCDEFDDEKTIEVTITGRLIPQVLDTIYDVVIKQEYIFTSNTLRSSGTMEYFQFDSDAGRCDR